MANIGQLISNLKETLDELEGQWNTLAAALGGGGASGIGNRRARGASKGARLARRSPADLEKMVGKIVSTLKGHKNGLKAEDLRKTLKIAKNELNRPLGMALAKKSITKKGKKRATTYFAA